MRATFVPFFLVALAGTAACSWGGVPAGPRGDDSTNTDGLTGTTTSTGSGGGWTTSTSTGSGGGWTTSTSTGSGGGWTTSTSTGSGGGWSTTSNSTTTTGSLPDCNPFDNACAMECLQGATVCLASNCVCPLVPPGPDRRWAAWRMPNPASAGLPNPATYDTSNPDVVYDLVTGLTWQRVVPASVFSRDEAEAYCAGLSLAGPEAWRLPTRIELISLRDFTRSGPSIDDSAFPWTPSERFWSSSPLAGDDYSAWCVDFNRGNSTYCAVSEGIRVRCVR